MGGPIYLNDGGWWDSLAGVFGGGEEDPYQTYVQQTAASGSVPMSREQFMAQQAPQPQPEVPAVDNLPIPGSDEAILQGSSQAQAADTQFAGTPFAGYADYSPQQFQDEAVPRNIEGGGMAPTANALDPTAGPTAFDVDPESYAAIPQAATELNAQMVPGMPDQLPNIPGGESAAPASPFEGYADYTQDQFLAESVPQGVTGGSADPLAQQLDPTAGPTAFDVDPEAYAALPETAAQAEAHTFTTPEPEAEPIAPEDRFGAGSHPGEASGFDPVKKAEVDKVVDQQVTPEDKAEAESIDVNSAIAAGSNAPPEEVSKTKTWLKEMFGPLLDKKELGRATLMFLGAMASGKSAGAALAFAGQGYFNRLDAKEAQINATADELIKKGEYTAPSIEKFRKTRDPEDLMMVPKDVAGSNFQPTGQAKTVFNNKTGKGMNVRQVKDHETKAVHWMNDAGEFINPSAYTREPYTVPGTKEYDQRIKDSSGDNAKLFKELQARDGTLKDGGTLTKLSPELVGRETAKWAAKNDVPLEDVGGVMQAAYAAALADKGGDPKKVIQSLEPYLNDQWIDVQTGDASLFVKENGKSDDVEKVNNIVNQYHNALGDQFPGQTKGVINQTIMEHATTEFANLRETDEDTFEALQKEAKKRGMSTFLWYLQTELATG